MHGPFHLVEVEVVGAAEDDGARGPGLRPLHEDQLVVRDPLLGHLGRLAEEPGLEALLALDVGEGGDELCPRRLGDTLQVRLLAPPNG